MLQAEEEEEEEEEDRFARVHVSIADGIFPAAASATASVPTVGGILSRPRSSGSVLDNVFTLPAFSARANYD